MKEKARGNLQGCLGAGDPAGPSPPRGLCEAVGIGHGRGVRPGCRRRGQPRSRGIRMPPIGLEGKEEMFASPWRLCFPSAAPSALFSQLRRDLKRY